MDFTSYSAQTQRMLLRPYALTDFDACFDLSHATVNAARAVDTL